MDAYSIHGDLYYQGYSGQAPPPGTAPVQAPPPGTAPTQLPAPTSAPLAPPGVAPAASSTPAAYYGTYPPPSYGYLPSSSERWSSFPMPAAEPHPYPSYPPTTTHPYDRPAYNHHPYYQEPFPYTQSYHGPQQAYMPLPPRGSDVTHFRKKRPFAPPQNLRAKNKPFKQSQQNFRSGGKNVQQAKRAFNADPRSFGAPFNGNPMVNNAQHLHPFWHNRVDEAPAHRAGKKRRIEVRGEGRPGRHDDRRKGDKRARPGWNKGKRKKGRKPGGEKRSMDPNGVAVGNSCGERGENRKFEGVPMTEEQAREEAAWLELHRDARKRVQEFLHTSSENESSQKAGTQDIQEAVGGDANVEMQDIQGAIEEAVGEDGNGEMVENDVAARPDGVDTPQADQIDASQADHVNALHSDCTEGQQFDHTCAMQSRGADLLVSDAHIDAVKANCADLLLSDSLHSDDVNTKQLDMVDTQKSDCGDAPQLATEIVKDLKTEGVQEVAGVDEVKDENNRQKSLAELVESAEKKLGKHQETRWQDELKEREERSFVFFTKLLEENTDLRNMYIEKCNGGAFECLMCHSKMKKKFSNLVSLVTHASNVLKTKKLPEHRGYSRAVCSLFGWDPYRIPKVPKVQVSVDNAPGDEECAPVGDTDAHATIGDVGEPDTVGDIVEEAPTGGAPVDDADVSKLRGDADESAPKDDADECTPMRDADGSVVQDFIKDAEKPVDKDVMMMKEPSQDGNEQAMFADDGEGVNKHTDGRNELVELAEVTDTAKLLQAGSEVIQDSVA